MLCMLLYIYGTSDAEEEEVSISVIIEMTALI
ncbi:hypothetical protein T12_15427 [Trichinella patagoniensis]|uniref:Uncharacterized protein n=1 Tax=Trichinella patagoniensis TaxID=990121 RepID=A0A0V0YY97_9BILA|nr:hypothetical protein T12_34 [Trichinella patagoniensis]KRY05301.1 hypothetical protein T12_15427 [Trichinella patagoniensis]